MDRARLVRRCPGRARATRHDELRQDAALRQTVSSGRLAALGLGVVALVLAGCGASNLYLLAAAGVLLDLAVQSHQVLSLRDIYALHPDARARVNAVYMTSVFLGGALASAITALLLQHWGWTGIALFAAALPTVGIALWLSERVRLGRLER